MKNYYDELQVSKTASKEVIEKVYKVLAKKYHPDTTKEINKLAAEEKFKAISEAYEILSNDEKRKKFDLELDKSNQTISYEEYINVVNQRDSLNLKLDTLRKEFIDFKSSTNYKQQYHNNYNNINNNQSASNFNNTTQYQRPSQNYTTNTNSPQQKTKYYNVQTGKPVSAFTYYKYKIKQFFSNLYLFILFIILVLLIFNALANSNLFGLFS